MTRIYIGIAIGIVSALALSAFLACVGAARDAAALLVFCAVLAVPGAVLGGIVGGMGLVLDELRTLQCDVRGLRWQCEHEYQSLIREMRATITEIRSLRWHDEQPEPQGPTTIKQL
jgi:hypothetical protein